MATICFNGKFVAQRLTGVQRYANRLVHALDALWPENAPAAELLCPAGHAPPALRRWRWREVGRPGMPLLAWEQWTLPRAARHGLLVNLSGSSPWVASRQWCTQHDAAVFDHPEAYTRRFVAWYRAQFRWQARRAARLLTVSSHSQRRLSLRMGLPQERWDLVPNGGEHLLRLAADREAVARAGLQGRRWFLAVGSLSPTKNLSMLLRAWAGWVSRPPDVDLVVIGDGHPGVFAGTPAGDSVPCAAGVRWVGRRDDPALKAFYQGALALLFPSLDEGFGLPALEAMSLACPVVAARAGAIPEVCGEAVLYRDPGQPADWIDAMERLQSDAALRQRLATAGPVQSANWSWDASARTMLRLLAQDGWLPS